MRFDGAVQPFVIHNPDVSSEIEIPNGRDSRGVPAAMKNPASRG